MGKVGLEIGPFKCKNTLLIAEIKTHAKSRTQLDETTANPISPQSYWLNTQTKSISSVRTDKHRKRRSHGVRSNGLSRRKQPWMIFNGLPKNNGQHNPCMHSPLFRYMHLGWNLSWMKLITEAWEIWIDLNTKSLYPVHSINSTREYQHCFLKQFIRIKFDNEVLDLLDIFDIPRDPRVTMVTE